MIRWAFLVACIACLPATAGAGGLEPFLARLAGEGTAKLRSGSPALLAWDREEAERSRARVWIHREPGIEWDLLRAEIAAADPGVTWEGSTGDFAQIVVSFDSLDSIAASPGVYYCLRPPRCVATVESEGLPGIGVPAFRGIGFDGSGVRIGVIDLGFDRYERLVGSELPRDLRTRSFFRSPSGQGDIRGDGEDHGTACAEIVHDISPGARLHLTNVETPVDLQNAVEWLLSEKVSIVTHSVGWYFGSLDGRGPVNDIVDSASRRGILWVNSAGNEAERHTWFQGRDGDGDRILEFDSSGDEDCAFPALAPGQTITLALLWDRWPTSEAIDLQIDMLDGAGDLLATSETDFQGYPYAFRYIEWTAAGTPPFRARVRQRRGAPDDLTIHLFRIGSGTRMEEHARSDRSLLAPSDSPEVIAAGATDWETGALDAYSSRGSVDLDPVKPELCAPVGVSTRTFGTRNFRGTSASSPHIAGAAALLASAGLHGGFYDLIWSREEIIRLLRGAAAPAPEIEVLGWGRLRMPERAAPARDRRASIRLLGNPAIGEARWSAPCGEAEILDAAGRVMARSAEAAWNGRDAQGRPAPAGIYWIRCPGGASARFLWLGDGGDREGAQ